MHNACTFGGLDRRPAVPPATCLVLPAPPADAGPLWLLLLLLLLLLQGTVLIKSAEELEGYSRSEENRIEELIKGIAGGWVGFGVGFGVGAGEGHVRAAPSPTPS
jgi:hypothetical protein